MDEAEAGGGPPLETVAELFAERYRIVERLPWSGLALLYRAEREGLRDISVAILPIDCESSSDHAAAFEKRAGELSHLVEPGIVRILGHGIEHGVPFLEMEFLDASTLADELADGPLDRDQALGITSELLDILGRAHAMGTFHWDLTPNNILLAPGIDGAEHVHVIGFGIARLVRESRNAEDTGPMGSGSGPSAERYLAPELRAPGKVDVRADVFSVAAVLHHMLTGMPPGTGSTAAPTDLAPAISKAMSERPEDRPRDAAELGRALAEGVGTMVEAPSFAPPPMPRPASVPVPRPASVPAPKAPLPKAADATARRIPPPPRPLAPPPKAYAPPPPPPPPSSSRAGFDDDDDAATPLPAPPPPIPIITAPAPPIITAPAPPIAFTTLPAPSDLAMSPEARPHAAVTVPVPGQQGAGARDEEVATVVGHAPDFLAVSAPPSAPASSGAADIDFDALMGTTPASSPAPAMTAPAPLPAPPPLPSAAAPRDVSFPPANVVKGAPRDPFAPVSIAPGQAPSGGLFDSEMAPAQSSGRRGLIAGIVILVAIALAVAFFIVRAGASDDDDEVSAPAPAPEPPPPPPVEEAEEPPAVGSIDMLEGDLPEPLQSIHRRVSAGQRIEREDLVPMYQHIREHEDDALAHLVLARAFMSLGWSSDTIERYESAYDADPTVTRDARMLEDLIALAGREESGPSATRALERTFGADALPALDAAIQAEPQEAVVARLERTRSRIAP